MSKAKTIRFDPELEAQIKKKGREMGVTSFSGALKAIVRQAIFLPNNQIIKK